MTAQYDAIIIGSGQAGKPLSIALGRAGRRVALIERAHIGGSCINEGCTPTKTMVASARIAHLSRRAADYGVEIGGAIHVDMMKVYQRKQAMIERFRRVAQHQIEHTPGITLVWGEAHFVAPKQVEVQTHQGEMLRLEAEHIFINTGTRSIHPNILGLNTVSVLDSSSIMELTTLPEHLLVLGGGYIGLEFGQMFRRFGSKVTIVQRGKQLLHREDSDVAMELLNILRDDGIEIFLNADVLQVASLAGDRVSLTLAGNGGEHIVSGSHLLAAVGRIPNTDRLNPAAAGIALDAQGFIMVNQHLETTVPGIYALGDAKGGAAFTHISYDDYRIVAANLLEHKTLSIQNRLVPYTVFTDPQLGRVGLTEQEALEQGYNIRVAKLPMRHVARALEMDETRGFMKAVVDRDTDQILGCAILGVEGGEIATVLQVAMMGKLPYTAIRDGVFSHPTLSESLNNLFMTLHDD